jgi:hypothetical protein
LTGFSALYARHLQQDQTIVDRFFEKLATPVDTATELEAEGADVASSYSLVGLVTMIMGGLCLVILPLAESALDVGATLGISVLLIVFGAVMYRLRPGKKTT